MKLYFSKFSPFARKVLLTAYITDQIALIETIDLGKTGSFKPDANYYKINPLLKVPALELNTEETLIDSPVICEFLNSTSKKDKIYPPNSKEYFFQKKLESIADGAVDATVLRRLESLRPTNLFSSDFDQSQKLKADNSLDYLEILTSKFKQPYMIGELATMCLLGYLDLRFPNEDWRTPRPNLTKWFDECRTWPAFANTSAN